MKCKLLPILAAIHAGRSSFAARAGQLSIMNGASGVKVSSERVLDEMIIKLAPALSGFKVGAALAPPVRPRDGKPR